jgi:hypothetical protein
VRRRAAEKALFLQPMDGWVPAPSPVMPPKLDYDALGMIPLTAPVATRTATDGDRLYTERTPPGAAPTPHEDASATEAAAAAAIERLEAILAEPAATPAPGPATVETQSRPHHAEPHEPPSHEPLSLKPEIAETPPTRETRRELPPITFLEVKTARRPGWLRTLGLLLLGAAGVGLLALAAIWGFQPRGVQVMGFAPRVAGLTVGLLGIACFSVAAYFFLDRLGLPRDRRS